MAEELESKLNSDNNEDFLTALAEIEKAGTTIVDKATGDVTKIDADGNIKEDNDKEENIKDSDDIKESEDKIEVETTTDSDNDIAEEQSEDNDDDSEDNEYEEVTEEDEKQTDEPEVESDDGITPTINTEEYEKYKRFYEHATGKIDVNGVSINGIDDPDKLLEIQQKWIESSAKLDELSKVRPILKSLKENGLVDDPNKFGFAMELLNGNPEAIKVLLKEKEIDVFDLDLDDVDPNKVESSKHYVSKSELEFNDFISESKAAKLEDQVADKIFKEWDDVSISEVVNDKTSRAIILDHMKSGWFDKIKEEIARQEIQDVSNVFRQKTDIEKYEIASNIVANRNRAKQNLKINEIDKKEQSEVQQKKIVKKAARKKSVTKDRIEKASKASKVTNIGSSSGSANTGKPKDLMELSDEDFLASINAML